MDIFRYREDLIGDYSAYVKGFLGVRDSEIEQFINARLDGGFLWPQPLVQLNPAFVHGPTIDELVEQKRLHATCREIFRRNKSVESPGGAPLRLHWHQAQALACAQEDVNYVLTTGTGSGKSLAYLIPIVDHVLKAGSGHGIQAIVVYPMNALANSQLGEMEKFLGPGFPPGEPPVRFARYTGQENEEARDAILANPPDVLLTNYVMLELILTRPREREHLIKAARGLKYLVLDELHTYRGRQGADVSMLVRRLRETLKAEDVVCVGTSATMGTGATLADVKLDVAAVASRLFGSPVTPDHVIGESLRRITPDVAVDDSKIIAQLSARVRDANFEIPSSFDAFCSDPMAGWLETTFGLENGNGTEELKRSAPRTIIQAGRQLAEIVGLDETICAAAIQRWLLHGYKCEPDPVSGSRPFAFRLHQFISKGDAVYATLGTGEDRWMTLQPQLFRPEHKEERLYPLAFCRACGQEYYSIYLQGAGSNLDVVPRPVGETETQDDNVHAGYLMVLEEPWPTDPVNELERLPDEWKELFHGNLRVRLDRRDKRPIPHTFSKNGKETPGGLPTVFLSTPFGFCPKCQVTYSSRQRKDFGKLATLSSEGRSTATTVLSLSAIRHLKSVSEIDEQARKLLSFTDNRQDASLQAGHFNDFAETGLLRSALYQAVNQAGSAGLTHDKLSHAVFDVLNLPFGDYAVDPTLRFTAKDDTKQVLRDLLAYRLYRDLRRGWRINLPNLEQVGLLRLEYKSLSELCAAEDEWVGKHTLLVSGSQSDRARWCRTLLDVLRRELAIKVDYLRPDYQDQLKQRSHQRLKEPWSIDEDEQMDRATLAYPRQSQDGDNAHRDSLAFVGPRSAFGQFLKREASRIIPGIATPGDDITIVIRQLFELLRIAGLLEIRERSSEVSGYQVPADAIVWTVGDGTVHHDPLLQTTESNIGGIPNPFFVSFYKETAQHLLGLEAREHTAQVPSKQREEREKDFREGRLKILYCSPTMELGDLVTRLDDARDRLVDLEDEEGELLTQMRAWSANWSSLLTSMHLPPETTVEGASAAIEVWGKVPGTLKLYQTAKRRVDGMNRDIDAYSAQVFTLIEELGAEDLGTEADVAIKGLAQRLVSAKKEAAKAEQTAQDITVLEGNVSQAEGEYTSATGNLEALCVKLPETAARGEQIAALEARESVLQRLRDRRHTVSSLSQGQSEDEMRAGLEKFDEESASIEILNLGTQEAALSEDISKAYAQMKGVQDELDQLQKGIGAEAAAQKQKIAEAEMVQNARTWAVKRFAQILLAQIVEQYRSQQEQPLLKRAGEFFSLLTALRFIGIEHQFDDNDTAHLLGKRNGNESIHVDGMSEGTRDQLYLALRLAYLEEYAGNAEPMPFIGDDLLTSFDDRRATAGLEALATISSKVQPILFTHHSRIVELARERLGNSVDIVNLVSSTSSDRTGALGQK